jgi:hypothetical protein
MPYHALAHIPAHILDANTKRYPPRSYQAHLCRMVHDRIMHHVVQLHRSVTDMACYTVPSHRHLAVCDTLQHITHHTIDRNMPLDVEPHTPKKANTHAHTHTHFLGISSSYAESARLTVREVPAGGKGATAPRGLRRAPRTVPGKAARRQRGQGRPQTAQARHGSSSSPAPRTAASKQQQRRQRHADGRSARGE